MVVKRRGTDETRTGRKKKEMQEVVLFFFNDTATTEIYTLSLHDALPIWSSPIYATKTI